MSERTHDDLDWTHDGREPPQPNGELVHWMQPKPLGLGAAGISAAAAGAFALGALATLAVLALLHMLGPQRANAVGRGGTIFRRS